VDANELALVRGWADTRATLERWNVDPWRVLSIGLAWSVAIAIALLAAVLWVARAPTPDVTPLVVRGVSTDATLGDALHLFGRNLLVLALHSMACVAGFMAGSSMPQLAESKTGLSRLVHEKAGKFAIAFVICATTFSLATQAYALGQGASTIAWQFGTTPPELILCLLPHALPELTALFLPLAAWIIASHRGQWHELLAATFVTTAIALPTLLIACLIEVFVSPLVINAVINPPV